MLKILKRLNAKEWALSLIHIYAVPLDESGKLGCQIIGLHPLAQLVHEHEAVVFIVVAVAADLLVQLLRRLDLCKGVY